MRVCIKIATRSWVGMSYFNFNSNCNYKGPFLRRNGAVAFALDRTLRLITVQGRPHRLLLTAPATKALHRHGAPQSLHIAAPTVVEWLYHHQLTDVSAPTARCQRSGKSMPELASPLVLLHP